jgi:hypothetical protein
MSLAERALADGGYYDFKSFMPPLRVNARARHRQLVQLTLDAYHEAMQAFRARNDTPMRTSRSGRSWPRCIEVTRLLGDRADAIALDFADVDDFCAQLQLRPLSPSTVDRR